MTQTSTFLRRKGLTESQSVCVLLNLSALVLSFTIWNDNIKNYHIELIPSALSNN